MDEQRKEFERWFYYELGQREKISLIEVEMYTEAMGVAWQAWQAAKASPVGGGVADDCGLALGDAAPVVGQRQLTPWQVVCMSVLVAGAAVSLACDVLCAFLLNPIYFARLCLVMSKRRLRQAGGMLADALA